MLRQLMLYQSIQHEPALHELALYQGLNKRFVIAATDLTYGLTS